MNSNDDSAALIERVSQAVSKKAPLQLCGGGSKQAIGNHVAAIDGATTLSTLWHTGVITYEPTELVVTVRSGTPLSELIQTLDKAGQMLAFEPPVLAGSTIGGVLACGLSGPQRPFNGSARDYVLGTRVINGQAQDLSFGGQVMKNVAGYDVSRVQVGAWGTLGVLLDVSMKVLPKPEAQLTLVHDVSAHALQGFLPLMRKPLPLSGAMLLGERRYLRLSGSEAAVAAAARELGGELLDSSEADIWQRVRDHKHSFFSPPIDDSTTLWRISVADHAPALALEGDYLYEWAGAQRWLKTSLPAEVIFEAVRHAGGHAIRYGKGSAEEPAFQPLQGPMQRLQSRLRDSFDPLRLFNRGRFHPELDSQIDLQPILASA